MSGKKYYPNNWQRYKDAPDDMFMNHTFDEIMEYKIGGWQLPSSVHCIIREEHIVTGKVKEYVYQRSYAAENKVKQLLERPEIEFTVCTPDQIHFVSQLPIDDEDDTDEPEHT